MPSSLHRIFLSPTLARTFFTSSIKRIMDSSNSSSASASDLKSQRERKIKTVFVTGATGYIGGSIAEKLRDSGYTVLGLVRSPEKAKLLEKRGIEPVLGALEDAKVLQEAAARSDAVINAASSDNKVALDTLINALAKTGKTLIHTGGSAVVADDFRGDIKGRHIYTEDTLIEPIPGKVARAALDRSVREAGLNTGIRTILICPTMIYGTGKGLHTESVQVPKLEVLSKEKGAGLYIGKGANIWSNVHIDDVADLYLLALEKAPSGSFFWAENGENSLKEVAEMVSHGLGFGGKTESWNAEDAYKTHGGWAQFAMASNSRVRAVNARATLGWNPTGPALAEVISKRL